MKLGRVAKWSGVGLGALLLAPCLLVAALVARVWLGQPVLEGSRAVEGVGAAATIARDADGVVHIQADSEADAYFALGYAHAQDRFFQMEAMRRIAAGRLAELVGPPAARIDERMRRLEVMRLAEGDVASLTPAVRATYEAYAAGVNAWLQTREGVAADELTLLLAGEPEPWRLADSLAWNRVMGLRLVGNWGSELMRLKLAKRLSPEQLADLWPDYPADGPVSVPDVDPEALEAALALADLTDPNDGSNAWVVAANRSVTGSPLLANDPHLGLTTPGTWHLVRMEAPGFLLAGATSPPSPAVILGHNGVVAWGLTNATTDTSDVYIERLDPEDPGRYLTPDGPRAFETRRETIRVRFGADREITVRRTSRGPVISDGGDRAAEGTALSLAHTGLLQGERSAESIHRINRAKSWPDVLAAVKLTKAPQQNVFYAGPDGIGMATGGLLPIRRNADGYMPADGAARDGDWIGFADVEAMPQSFNPARGWVANANNRIAGDDYPLWLGQEWGYPGRMARIETLLTAQDTHDAASMQAILHDDRSTVAERLLPIMLEQLDRSSLSSEAAKLLPMLRAWNGRTNVNQPEPLIFFAWAAGAVTTIFADELGEDFLDWYGLRQEPLEHVLQNRPEWCADAAAGCGPELAKGLENALAWIVETYGDDPEAWRWGEAHQARFRHLAFGFIPVLNRAFDVRLPAPGAQETVNRAAFSVGRKDRPFDQRHGPGLRAVYDLADLDRSLFIIGPGQSGRLFSRNRSDLAEKWRDGAYLTLGPLEDPMTTLTLEPAP